MIGFGIFVGDGDADTIPTNPKLVFNGGLKQYNWVSEAESVGVKNSNSGYISSALNAAIGNDTYKRDNGTANMGIVFLNNQETNIENNTGIDYQLGAITIMSVTGQVYSIPKTETEIYTDYTNADRTTVNGLYVPQFKYDGTLGGQQVAEGGNEHLYREGDVIKVMFPSGDTKEINLATLVNIAKYANQDLNLQITVKDENGNAVSVTDDKITISKAGEYTITYTVTDTLFYDKDGNVIENSSVQYSWNVAISVSLKDTSVPNAYFDYDTTKQTMGYAKKSMFAGGNTQYLPFLAGLKIYDYVGQNAYLRFDGDSDFNKIAAAEITGYTSENHVLIKVTLTDGGVINVDTTARAVSGGSTYTGTLNTSGNTLYYVNGGTTSATTTTWVISNYTFVGNNGVEIASGTVTFSNCENGSVPTGNFSTTIKYTVTYNANGGDCGQTLGYATSAATAITLPTPTQSGYTFLGWYTAAIGGTRVGGAGDSYTPSSNITLYAQWGAPCTVTYDANGGSCTTDSEKFDGKTLILPTATKEGHTFLGWYTAATGGERIGGAGQSYNPTGDTTLYAHWQEPTTVTYNANGGSCDTASEQYDGDLTLPTATKEGHTFLGWYTTATGGTKIGDAGATYIPSANITLYAQWQINSYTIKVTTNNATVKVNGTAVSNNGTVSIQYGAQVTVEVTYSESDSQSTTITGTDGATYTSPFNMPAQNVTINATSSGCVTPDTLITLANGTQVRVDSLTGNEELLVWNMETGRFDKATIMFIDSDPTAEYEIIHLYFSDGTDVKVIYEHGFWDYDLNKYVYLDRNAADYIGHTFAKQNGDALEKVQLVDVVIETEITEAWSPVTAGHLCYFVNGMLSMPGGVGGLFNIFEVDPETMTYDYEQLQKDIETYGLYTYEEMNAICPLSEKMFNEAGGAYLKISIGKGNLTIEELIEMIERYSEFFE
ncbi:MAG: hypothetical protein E7617_03125 [Ruminococcaceae bacterium]|nr:hypothetical protein [Oscillospiraceae bacterium]